MYCRGLALSVLDSFEDHAGFDGVILGVPGSDHHFEFTFRRGHPVVASPTPEELLVFYVPEKASWQEACERMLAAGFREVPSLNPYWDIHGRTFADRDSYRVVLSYCFTGGK